MKNFFTPFLPLALAWGALTTAWSAGEDLPAKAVEAEFREEMKPLLQDYCFDCHGDGMKEGDFSMDGFDSTAAFLEDKQSWLRIWENLRTEMMPPAKEDWQPTLEERRDMIAWIESRVFKLDPDNPDPGRVTIRRLNRVEYRHTIRDVVGVDFNTTDNFPADDTGFGFDTIGDVLTISPLLMEKYLDAAEEIALEALPHDAGKPKPLAVEAGDFRDQSGSQTARFMEADTAQTVATKRRLPGSGEYLLKISYAVESENGRPRGQSATWQVLVDGRMIKEIDFNSDTSRRGQLSETLTLGAGEHRFGFTIVPKDKGEGPGTAGIRVASFTLTRINGGDDWNLYPESYQRIFVDGLPPADPGKRADYLRKIVETFATRAFRRPPRARLVDQLTALALDKTREDGAKFVDGVRLAVTAILTSPSFLFRSEVQAEPDNPGKVVPVDEFALASRLSYFLWSSAPDETLLELASRKELRFRLREQIDRMLTDPKANRMVENFVGQWLQARDLPGLAIDTRRILRERDRRKANRIFNRQTRRDMRTETELFFRHVLLENRPVLELLDADYSFLNENLAQFYQIPGVAGNHFRRVSFKDHGKGRGGLLGQGTFLIVTSQATRTSPVKRGLFVLDNILGTPAPPAPPDVPELEDTEKKLAEGATMRELMEIHREKPLCASCHERMDPIGLALENFNALGQWRETEDGKPIDSAGRLITGEKFSNVMELKTILATSRKRDFYRCLTEKMLTYALGRGVEFYDAPTINAIVRDLSKESGGLKDLIYAIVESVPFQKRRGDGDDF